MSITTFKQFALVWWFFAIVLMLGALLMLPAPMSDSEKLTWIEMLAGTGILSALISIAACYLALLEQDGEVKR